MLPPHVGEMSILEDESLFEFPEPPESIPDWADTQAKDWRGLDFFDIEVRAEALSGRDHAGQSTRERLGYADIEEGASPALREQCPSLSLAEIRPLSRVVSSALPYRGGTLLETDIAALVAIRGGGGSFRMVRHLAGVA